jgi:hypothetical protein
MCYVIYLSTTSDEDFRALAETQFSLYRAEDAPDVLYHPHRWYLECQYGGCSCHFRHLHESAEMCFGPPEDCPPEDDDDIEATAAVYDLIKRLVQSGHGVDLVDTWSDELRSPTPTLEVSLSKVARESFRFFHGYHFAFIA